MEQKSASVRSTVKAIVIQDGNVLLNRCRDRNNGEYFSLPGGGQQQYETLEQAIKRECFEETGYSVEPVRFAALMEEICLDPFIQSEYAQYAHKMLHIFLCRLASTERKEPTETDDLQISTEWIPVSEAPKINLLPEQVRERFVELLNEDCPAFLGSHFLEYNHG